MRGFSFLELFRSWPGTAISACHCQPEICSAFRLEAVMRFWQGLIAVSAPKRPLSRDDPTPRFSSGFHLKHPRLECARQRDSRQTPHQPRLTRGLACFTQGFCSLPIRLEQTVNSVAPGSGATGSTPRYPRADNRNTSVDMCTWHPCDRLHSRMM